MQYRQLPPVETIAEVRRVWEAVPVSPEETDDCCQRLCDRVGVETRNRASEWLVFLTALDCVYDDGEGYYRDRTESDAGRLSDAFSRRVFGVDDTLSVLQSADAWLTTGEVVSRLPTTTRRRIERTNKKKAYAGRLLGWGVVFGLFESDDTSSPRTFSTGSVHA